MLALKSDMHPTLNDEILSRLRSKNVLTVLDILTERPERLVRCTGLLQKDISSIRKELQYRFGGVYRKTLIQLEAVNQRIIPTGVSCLDTLLGNGLYTGQIYEVCGTSASGKTQLCLTVALNAATNNRVLVYYIDSKQDFRVSRIVEMMRAMKMRREDVNVAMNNIKVSPVQSVSQLFKILHHLVKVLCVTRSEQYRRLIIIDSLPAVLFKFSNDNQTNYSLNNLSNLCRYIANHSQSSIFTVNLLTHWNLEVEQRATRQGDSSHTVSPALGKYWSHIPSTRLLMEKLGHEYRKLTVWKSFQLKIATSCTVRLTEAGVIPIAKRTTDKLAA